MYSKNYESREAKTTGIIWDGGSSCYFDVELSASHLELDAKLSCKLSLSCHIYLRLMKLLLLRPYLSTFFINRKESDEVTLSLISVHSFN